MLGFNRGRPTGPIEPAFVTPPTETPPAVAVEARVADVDAKLLAIARIPRDDRAPNLLWQENRLLDLRNAIRPARVPSVGSGSI